MAKYKVVKQSEQVEVKGPSKFFYISGIIQTFFGILTLLVYIAVLIKGTEIIGKWTITLVIALLFIYVGIKNIKDYKSIKNKK